MFFKRKTREPQIFISIGAGINQLPLIREAKKLGFTTIGVDQNISAPGFSECDIKIQESILNPDEIYTKIEEALLDGNIEAILTRSYGDAVRSTATLAEKIGIPYIPAERISDLIEKKKMKEVLQKNSIPTPEYITFTSAKHIKFDYPFIIKPSVGHAKSGVKLIRNEKELEAYIKQSDINDKHYIVEEYIDGDEIIAMGIVSKGKFYLADITDKITTAPPYFVDIMHISPSKHADDWPQIESIGQKIAEAFEIKNSPLFIEIRKDSNDLFYVIETAAEFGGEFLADVLIPERTGYNFMKEAILAIAGKGFTPPSTRKIRNSAVVRYITGNDGILQSYSPIEHDKENHVVFSRMFKDKGAKIKKPSSNHERIGAIVTKAETRDEAILAAQEAEKSMSIKIKSPREKADE